jgi:hypothetical protein
MAVIAVSKRDITMSLISFLNCGGKWGLLSFLDIYNNNSLLLIVYYINELQLQQQE